MAIEPKHTIRIKQSSISSFSLGGSSQIWPQSIEISVVLLFMSNNLPFWWIWIWRVKIKLLMGRKEESGHKASCSSSKQQIADKSNLHYRIELVDYEKVEKFNWSAHAHTLIHSVCLLLLHINLLNGIYVCLRIFKLKFWPEDIRCESKQFSSYSNRFRKSSGASI